jgi:LPXTG-site transpeptidase (sortase) family protein
MSYRRQQNHPLSGILQTLVLGIVLGLVFFSFDNERPTTVSTVTQAPIVTPPPKVVPTRTAATEPPPAADALPEAPPVPTTVFIPTAGVHTSIIEAYLDGTSWDVTHLGANAGHLQGTASFDQTGNVVLAGHVELADGRRGVFARIGDVSVGDPIIVEQGAEERHYIVRTVETTSADDLSVLYPTRDDQLTLITCDSYDFLRDVYLQRTVVIAERIA